jgi:hypothetical protein
MAFFFWETKEEEKLQKLGKSVKDIDLIFENLRERCVYEWTRDDDPKQTFVKFW